MQQRTMLRIEVDLTGMPDIEDIEHAESDAMQWLRRRIEKILSNYFANYPAEATVFLSEDGRELSRLFSGTWAYSAPKGPTL